MLRPILPYLDYAINKDYIAEELCENKEKPELQCDGKCHLAKEVKKVSEEKPTSNKPKKKKKDADKPIYLQKEFEDRSSAESFSTELKAANGFKLKPSRGFYDISLPPPQIF